MKHVLTVALGDSTVLVDFLARRLEVAPIVASGWIARGAVEVNRRRADGHSPLELGARVMVRAPHGERVGTRLEPAPPLVEVFRDQHLLVIAKPVGMVSQADKTNLLSVETLARRRDPTARAVHRIDRDASGLVLLALDGETHARAQAAFASNAARRHYLALSSSHVSAPLEISLRIARDRRDTRRRVAMPASAPGGQAALTRILASRSVGDACGLLVAIDTGRTHQIRVHLASQGHPLVGDTLYGGAPAPRLMLHAWRLALDHPVTGQPLALVAPPPAELAPFVDLRE